MDLMTLRWKKVQVNVKSFQKVNFLLIAKALVAVD